MAELKNCIMTCIKNEHEYLNEWIQYHLKIGIDHIFIFEDMDSDSHKGITEKYKEVTLSSILDILDEKKTEEAKELKYEKKINVQHLYFKYALEYLKNTYPNYEWCFVIDVDEFITLESENNIKDVMSEYKNNDAVILYWKCYGANGLIDKPDYNIKGVVDTYAEPATGKILKNTYLCTKICHNLRRYEIKNFINQHKISNKACWCNTDNEKNWFKTSYSNIYIRHYITKSWEEYVWKRRVRGYPWGENRSFEFFFLVNPEMEDKKEELIKKLENEVLVVLPYKVGTACENELKLSLRSWRKFCRFKYHFIVIGEFDNTLKKEFPWVEFIIYDISDNTPQQNIIQNMMDVIYKKYCKAYEGFIYMSYDKYAIRDFGLDDIISIENTDEKNKLSYWSHYAHIPKNGERDGTNDALQIDYTTRFICYYKFDTLKRIWNKYSITKEKCMLETVYFHFKPALVDIMSKRIMDINNLNDLHNALNNPDKKFVFNTIKYSDKDFEQEMNKTINGINKI